MPLPDIYKITKTRLDNKMPQVIISQRLVGCALTVGARQIDVLRNVDPRADDFVLPDIFALDEKMKAALPGSEKFSYVSVADAICPARQCPLVTDGGIPLSWDHAHLTAEGSVYVVGKLVPLLGLRK